MRKMNFFALCIAFVGATAWAEQAVVTINSMMCTSCVDKVTQQFKGNPSVKSATVSLKEKTLSLDFVPEKTLADDDIKKMVKTAGFTVDKIERKSH